MQTHIEACPGGLAIVVPETLAKKAGLCPGAVATLEWSDGTWFAKSDTLDALLAKITPENLHGEQFSGPPVGSESL